MDVLTLIKNALEADDYIKSKTAGRIKFYEYPETADVNAPYIVIDPISPPLPQVFGDDQPIADSYIYQVDVWTKNRHITRLLAKRVSAAMRSVSFGNLAGSVDEYDKETGIFRDARRYRSTIYDENFN